jgi:hypothetical protein
LSTTKLAQKIIKKQFYHKQKCLPLFTYTMSARFCQEEQVAESELLLMTQEFDQMHKGKSMTWP